MMKLKRLASMLESVDAFDHPDYMLEQYKTSADEAARSLYTIEATYGDVRGKVVADLGCGTGILGIGAALLGAWFVRRL